MKKKNLVLITSVVLMLCACVFALVGCSEEEKVTYSVTVLGLDENPVQGVTVNLQSGGKTRGSGVTNEDGEAKIKLAAGKYTVALAGIDAGLAYSQVTLSSATRETTLLLEVAKVTYTVKVLDKDGKNAKNVTVTWSSGTAIAGTQTTDDNGEAKCELDYGDYSVTVSKLPAGNICTEVKNVTGESPAAQFELVAGQTVNYSVTVRSEGGFKFAKTDVFVYNSSNLDRPIGSGKTDETGVFSFSMPAGSYAVELPVVQQGYTVVSSGSLSKNDRNAEIVLHSEVIADPVASDKVYVTGDIINDFTFYTPYEVDGKPETYKISELLKTYKAVVINNWGTGCTYCVQEMPAMDSAYKKVSDKLQLLAVSNYLSNGKADTSEKIAAFHEDNDYSFPMMRDNVGLSAHFALQYWPTTVIIDRYGAIAHIEEGALIDEDTWDKMFEKYTADDYVQTFVAGENESIKVELARPTVTVPADHYEKVAEAINGDNANITWRGETNWDMAWPFVLKKEDGVSPDKEVLCASSSGTPNTVAMLYGDVTMAAGKVLTFDYYADTEEGDDYLTIALDESLTLIEISGQSGGWKTCYLYSELADSKHELGFMYVKGATGNTGKDNVFIRNFRFEELSVITEPTDMLRNAAYGNMQDKKYQYYAGVEMGDDNYYHVKLSSLQNSDKAGTDQSPILLVNLLSVTNFTRTTSRKSINQLAVETKDDSDEYVYDCTFTIGNVTRDYRADIVEYCRVASASDIYGCMPVDKELHDLLVAFMAKVSGSNSHAEEWLEACCFYSHYGSNDGFIGNPIIGLSKKTAIPMTEDSVYEANLTRLIAPFPTEIYTFTPSVSAVYKIESLIPDNLAAQYAAQVWLYDDQTTTAKSLAYCGDNRLVRDMQNEQNFELYHYMTAGHKYYIEVAFLMQEMGTLDFKITSVGQSATELLPCSSNFYSSEDGSLMGAVSYYKDEDGYYRVGDENDKHADDSYIYLDVSYPTALTNFSLSALVDQNLKVPMLGNDCGYKTFDFRYTIAYNLDKDEEIYICTPKLDLVEFMTDFLAANPAAAEVINVADYKDYTQDMTDYIEGAQDGLVKVDQHLVDILTLFFEVRINFMTDNVYELALENEWLRFCWYYHTYSAPAETAEA